MAEKIKTLIGHHYAVVGEAGGSVTQELPQGEGRASLRLRVYMPNPPEQKVFCSITREAEVEGALRVLQID